MTPLICYTDRRFQPRQRKLIDKCVEIVDEYQADGYDLTVRQLYYQLVSLDLIPNTVKSYNNICSLIANARRAGLIDWDAIVDRMREVVVRNHWRNVPHILGDDAAQFHVELWQGQPNYVEVWFEKDALAGVFERACHPLDVPFLSCHGYASDSALWRAGQRIGDEYATRERCVVLQFSDHDPSGIDMTRDIRERLELFDADGVEVKRIALTMDQVRQYNPPPNPAKTTDSRYLDYARKYGQSSWELDALNPRALAALVVQHVTPLIERRDLWDERLKLRRESKALLDIASKKWEDLAGVIRKKYRNELRLVHEFYTEEDGALLDTNEEEPDE